MRLGFVGLLCCASTFAQPKVDFDRHVHPVLATRCLACHSAEKRSGGLSLANYSDLLEGGRSGAAIKPGDSGASLLMRRVTGPSSSPTGSRDFSPISEVSSPSPRPTLRTESSRTSMD